MRILQLSDVDGFHPEGTYLRVAGLSNALQMNSHAVTVACHRGANVVYGQFAKRNLRLLKVVSRVEQLTVDTDAVNALTDRVEREFLGVYLDFARDYDIIHAHKHALASAALRFRGGERQKVLFDVHGLLFPMGVAGQIEGPHSRHQDNSLRWQKSLFREADGVSFVSDLLRRRMSSRFGLNRSWDYQDVLRLRSSWDAMGSTVLMYAGTLGVQHGAPYLLTALSRALTDDSLSSRIRVVIVGTGPYGRKFMKLRDQHPRRVVLVDTVPYSDLPTYLAAADVHLIPHPRTFLMDSIMSNKLLNCLASAKATVATRLSYSSTLLQDGKHILFCDPDDPHTMVSAIESIIGDMNWARSIGREGSLIAKVQFDWSTVAKAAEKVYQELASE
jgi:glycosyltransferase involved in cell wall biosynthesis